MRKGGRRQKLQGPARLFSALGCNKFGRIEWEYQCSNHPYRGHHYSGPCKQLPSGKTISSGVLPAIGTAVPSKAVLVGHLREVVVESLTLVKIDRSVCLIPQIQDLFLHLGARHQGRGHAEALLGPA